MRLDVYLSDGGYTASRSRAQALIASGSVRVNGCVIRRPSFRVEGTETIEVEDRIRYVSRGGLKLEAALIAFGVDCTGRTVLDIGASSGGFTDCVLRHGAELVYAVDVGTNQLSPQLREDPRVVCREHCNARYLRVEDFPVRPTLAVMDVSFISQTLIHPALAGILPPGAEYITLIKPQFECGRGVLRNGIVRSEEVRRSACARVKASAEACGFCFCGEISSPIPGGDGNLEYLGHFIRKGECT